MACGTDALREGRSDGPRVTAKQCEEGWNGLGGPV